MAATADIVMPMEQEGSKSVVRAWLKKIGEPVKRDEPIVELETDKVNYELDSPAAGILLKIVAKADAEVPVGDPLGCIGEKGEALPEL